MRNAAIEARLRKLERQVEASIPARPAQWIVTRGAADEERQIAAMIAAGTYQRGWPLIAWRVVSPSQQETPCHHLHS